MRAITSRFNYTAPDNHLSAGFAKDSRFSFTIRLHEPQQNCSKGICAVILEYRLYNEQPALNMVGRCFFQRIFTCDTFFVFRQFIILHSNPFQSFVKIEKGIEGLIHISQICERRIAKPEDALKIGQKVNAKIVSIDKENKKIELSIREIEGTSQDTDLMVNEEKSVAVQDEEKGMTTTKETEKSMINTDNNKEIITKD